MAYSPTQVKSRRQVSKDWSGYAHKRSYTWSCAQQQPLEDADQPPKPSSEASRWVVKNTPPAACGGWQERGRTAHVDADGPTARSFRMKQKPSMPLGVGNSDGQRDARDTPEDTTPSSSPTPGDSPLPSPTKGSYRDQLRAIGQEALQKTTWSKSNHGRPAKKAFDNGDSTPTTAASPPGTPQQSLSVHTSKSPEPRNDSNITRSQTMPSVIKGQQAHDAFYLPPVDRHGMPDLYLGVENQRAMTWDGSPIEGVGGWAVFGNSPTNLTEANLALMPGGSPTNDLMATLMPQLANFPLDGAQIAEQLRAAAPCHYDD